MNHKGALALFHINTCPLPKNIEELAYFIRKTKTDFYVIGIREWRILKYESPIKSINLKNYSYESSPTKSLAGITILYINNFVSTNL